MDLSDDLLDSIFEKIATGKTLIKNRRTLTIDYVPENLPFRDEESKTIAQALSVVLKGARTSNLLLFGKPGTGKTAVVKNVIEHLRKKTEELGIEVTVPLVNAKTANTAYKVLYEIAEEIGINKKEESKLQVPFTGLSMGEATDRILDFIQKKKLHVVLVIDEIDSLVDKNGDDILYNFTRANERISEGGFISLIGISNSLTFKDKIEKDTNYEVIKNSTTHTKIVTLAIMKSKNGNTGEVSEIYSSLCKHIEQEPLTQRRITQIINELD